MEVLPDSLFFVAYDGNGSDDAEPRPLYLVHASDVVRSEGDWLFFRNRESRSAWLESVRASAEESELKVVTFPMPRGGKPN